MTTVSKTPFQGLTREGLEDIQKFIQDGAMSSKAAIETVAKDHGETLFDFYHPSQRAYEIDWENSVKDRDRSRRLLREGAIVVPLLAIAVTAVLATASTSLYFAPEAAGNLVVSLFLPLVTLGAALSGTVIASREIKSFLRERRLGFSGYFKKFMAWRSSAAWATSENALYVAHIDRDREGLVEVRRLPFSEIQGGVYAEMKGVQIARVYENKGECFALATPQGPEVSCAQDLVKLINKIKR